MHRNTFVAFRVLLAFFVVVAPSLGSAQRNSEWDLLGTCNESGECSVHINDGPPGLNSLCGQNDLSALWTRGSERFLIQCKEAGTAEENSIFIVDTRTNLFRRLDYGRFVTKKSLADLAVVVVPDKFASRSLCQPINKQKLRASDFVILAKMPSSEVGGNYCYEVIYLSIVRGRLSISRSAKGGNNESISFASKPISTEERVILIPLLDAIRRWNPVP